MSNIIQTFHCAKCRKEVPTINKIIHEAQCRGEDDIDCPKCQLRFKKCELNDHLFCHSLETQENSLENRNIPQ